MEHYCVARKNVTKHVKTKPQTTVVTIVMSGTLLCLVQCTINFSECSQSGDHFQSWEHLLNNFAACTLLLKSSVNTVILKTITFLGTIILF